MIFEIYRYNLHAVPTFSDNSFSYDYAILKILRHSSCNNTPVFNLYHHKSVRSDLFQSLQREVYLFEGT